jgi:hypothetical protein
MRIFRHSLAQLRCASHLGAPPARLPAMPTRGPDTLLLVMMAGERSVIDRFDSWGEMATLL